jgi:hypothetical protein
LTLTNVAALIADVLVLDLNTHALQHTLAELGVHRGPVSLVSSLLEGKLNDLAQSATIGLVLGLRHNLQDLGGDTVELLRSHLVQCGLDLTLHNVGRHVALATRRGTSSVGTNAAGLPASGTLLQSLQLHTSSKRHGLVGILLPLAAVLATLAASTTLARCHTRRAHVRRGVSRDRPGTHARHARTATEGTTTEGTATNRRADGRTIGLAEGTHLGTRESTTEALVRGVATTHAGGAGRLGSGRGITVTDSLTNTGVPVDRDLVLEGSLELE